MKSARVILTRMLKAANASTFLLFSIQRTSQQKEVLGGPFQGCRCRARANDGDHGAPFKVRHLQARRQEQDRRHMACSWSRARDTLLSKRCGNSIHIECRQSTSTIWCLSWLAG